MMHARRMHDDRSPSQASGYPPEYPPNSQPSMPPTAPLPPTPAPGTPPWQQLDQWRPERSPWPTGAVPPSTGLYQPVQYQTVHPGGTPPGGLAPVGLQGGSSGWGRLVALVLALFVVFGGGLAFGRFTAPVSAQEPGATDAATVAATPGAPTPDQAGATTSPGGSPAASQAAASQAAASQPAASQAAASQAAATPPAATPLPEGQVPDWKLLDEAYTQLRQNYVDPSALDPNLLIQGAISGMMSAVNDKGHTGYLTAAEVAARDQSLKGGSYVGIGVMLDDRAGPVTIVRVFPNSPALEGGVVVGDQIVAVDGVPTDGQAVGAIQTRVLGAAGTSVKITLKHADGTESTLSLVRRNINPPLVSWAMAPGTTDAVIRLEKFSTGAADAVTKAIGEAKAAGATGIVFDMRGNIGGWVDEAVKTASQFLSSGTVYVSVDRSGKQTRHDVLPGGTGADIPLVVLVDGQTASAAEIVTGAIQDAGRAKVVGQTTYGTGTVVGTWPLSDGSAVTIGIERWLTPKGHAIWREGLTPDQVVGLPNNAIYITPDEFSTLGPAGISGTNDTQLVAALNALGANLPPASIVVPTPTPAPSATP